MFNTTCTLVEDSTTNMFAVIHSRARTFALVRSVAVHSTKTSWIVSFFSLECSPLIIGGNDLQNKYIFNYLRLYPTACCVKPTHRTVPLASVITGYTGEFLIMFTYGLICFTDASVS